jgi:hypothetical protein
MREPPFTEEEVRKAVANALCWSDVLRALGYRPAGKNILTLQRHACRWGISTDHFDQNAARRRAGRARRRPLNEVLVKDSTFSRGHLKKRLYEEGLKQRQCELCGQAENWHGRRMSLVLDHINGDARDHRIENLQIVCPNCAATLDTHCGRNIPRERTCAGCRQTFEPRLLRQRYCTLRCFNRSRAANAGRPAPTSTWGRPLLDRRTVPRPPYEQLMREISETSYLAVSRKYGVSDNAIRKWVRQYEREMELAEPKQLELA